MIGCAMSAERWPAKSVANRNLLIDSFDLTSLPVGSSAPPYRGVTEVTLPREMVKVLCRGDPLNCLEPLTLL